MQSCKLNRNVWVKVKTCMGSRVETEIRCFIWGGSC